MKNKQQFSTLIDILQYRCLNLSSEGQGYTFLENGVKEIDNLSNKELDEKARVIAIDVDEVVGNIRKAVRDEHDTQLYYVVHIKAGSIPKTSSAKIQRSAYRVKFLEKH